MTTYRLPLPPESGVVWQWSPMRGEWVEWHRDGDADRWYATEHVGWASRKWAALLQAGEVTSEEPIAESKEELADKVVHAAVVWCVSEHFAPMLRAAVGRYNRKLHQLSDERTTG